MAAPGELPPPRAMWLGGPPLGPGGTQMQGGKIAMPELVRSTLDAARPKRESTTLDLRDCSTCNWISCRMTPLRDAAATARFRRLGCILPQALRAATWIAARIHKGPVQVIVVDHAERPSGN